MSDTTPSPYQVDLQELFDPQTLERLHAIADNHRFKLKTLVKKMILSHIDEWDPEVEEDTPIEIVEANLRIGLREAFSGQTLNAREALAQLKKEFEPDADD